MNPDVGLDPIWRFPILGELLDYLLNDLESVPSISDPEFPDTVILVFLLRDIRDVYCHFSLRVIELETIAQVGDASILQVEGPWFAGDRFHHFLEWSLLLRWGT